MPVLPTVPSLLPFFLPFPFHFRAVPLTQEEPGTQEGEAGRGKEAGAPRAGAQGPAPSSRRPLG